jgi:DNA replication and repair protein RecF
MIVSSLQLNSFRCFENAFFEFHPSFNFISGPNGVGKTALLEALTLLSVGHSFRTREIQPLIQASQYDMTLFARLVGGHTLSVQKSKNVAPQIRINAQPCLRKSELNSFLPSQVIYQDLFQIIDAGPAVRRQLLDWGMFHVKPNYAVMLKQYRQALKQRNALLKIGAKQAELAPWNQTLHDLGVWIDEARAVYFSTLLPQFHNMLASLSSLECDLTYYNGWDRNAQAKPLIEMLEASYGSDLKKQYTQFGPHQADLQLNTANGKAKLYLSRGQQKIILMALRLAQAQVLDKPCLYIWDDVCAELDTIHLDRLTRLMQLIPGQFFITGIDLSQTSLFRESEGKLIALSGGHDIVT